MTMGGASPKVIVYPDYVQVFLKQVAEDKQGELKGIYNRMQREGKSEQEITAELVKKVQKILESAAAFVDNKPKPVSKSSGTQQVFDLNDIKKIAMDREAKRQAQEAEQLTKMQPYSDVARDLVVVTFSVAPQNFMPAQKVVQPAGNKKPLVDAPQYPVWMLQKPYVSPANPKEIQGKLKTIFNTNKDKTEQELRKLFDNALAATKTVSSHSSGNAAQAQAELKNKLPARIE